MVRRWNQHSAGEEGSAAEMIPIGVRERTASYGGRMEWSRPYSRKGDWRNFKKVGYG